MTFSEWIKWKLRLIGNITGMICISSLPEEKLITDMHGNVTSNYTQREIEIANKRVARKTYIKLLFGR